MSDTTYTGKNAYYGQVATQYDEDRKVEALWGVEQDYVRRWVETLPAGSKVLDVPCGTGRFVPFFANRNLTLLARDISADMVAEIARRYPEVEVDTGVADAEHLPFADDAVDAILSWRFIHLLPAPVVERALREFRRVCRGDILLEVLQAKTEERKREESTAVARFRHWYRSLRPRPSQQPWSHITSYTHDESNLCNLFSEVGLKVKARDLLDNHAGPAAVVYQLTKC
ncbi:MAG TPA: class I SAM-dependent methyltransferase [Opitutaceae bacterium]|nr:class I SAM-dependent methyltransferase [Opitutaceae bacterium]